MNCGLLGRKLGHSYSPQIHARLGDYGYCLYEKEPEQLEDFLRHGDFAGLNVTIPYKKAVIPYLDDLSPIAGWLGAVNTIVRRCDGSLVGHNTDYFGFATMVKKSGLDVLGKKALVLGSGGASNTAAAVLEEIGAKVIVISRQGENNYDNLDRHTDAAVIVNATPVGMYPNVDAAPVTLDGFPMLEGVLDLIYNPARTKLLLEAENRGLIAVNGLLMLVAQAKESAEWFTGQPIDDTVIPQIHNRLRGQMENIVLIGMPGCGKSTVAAILAEKLGRKAIDADREIEAAAGCTIPEIFEKEGEAGFRAWETRILESLSAASSCIIATGGGCVTQERNLPLLHRNSRVFWLKRDISALPTEGRPLSRQGKLREMYEVRKPLYQKFAHHTIENNGTAEAAAEAIISILEETV